MSPLTGHSSRVESVSWNIDGTKLASGGDKTVRIWAVGSAGTFECQSTLRGQSDRSDFFFFSFFFNFVVFPFPEFLLVLTRRITKRRVFSVPWGFDGTIASGSQDKTIKIWNTNTGQCVSDSDSSSEM